MSAPHGPTADAEDEPQTPMWSPALGAALFIAFGLWLIVSTPTGGLPESVSGSAAGQTAPAK